ncbi:MAG: SDR family NAD(P)-dependent oxidoreductase [Oscillospiraceae bacterium]|jgi:short-subunit dehydrogenase|nr:SDR family NAD(P)-dependent oxidoreductase [Oscillospiraceae bacterium]
MTYPYGKTVFVTGGSSGIGAQAVRLFAECGYTVYTGARRFTHKEYPQGAGRVITLPLDVTQEASAVAAVAAATRDEKEPCRILLHCAGMGIAGAAEDTPEEAIRTQMEVNYFGVLRMNRLLLPHMRANGGGLVIIISSVAGRVPLPFQSHYASGKFALDSYAQSLAMEAAPYGIRVSLIEPGDTATGFTAARRMTVPEDSIYKEACQRAVARMAHDEEQGASPVLAAKAALRLAKKTKVPMHVTVGAAYKLVICLRRLLPTSFFNRILRKLYG